MPEISFRDAVYLSDDPNETTFKHDNKLPPLPVPEVKQSIFKLLDSVKAISTDENEYKETERKALEFILDPKVQVLQESLLKRAKETRNYICDWWLEFAYLRGRKPIMPFSNMVAPFAIMKEMPLVREGQPTFRDVRARRASLAIYFQLSFWNMLREERVRPFFHHGIYWSNDQLRYLFNTVRQPGETKDQLKNWFRTVNEMGDDEAPASTEVIILHRGHVFAINPVTMVGKKASILPAPLIEKQLRFIENWAARKASGPGVGALTTADRSDWAQARAKLEDLSSVNRVILDRIDKALSVVVLDDTSPAPKDTNDIFRHSMCGIPSDRWADKSISLIAFKNGTFGANADHTPFDGFCTGVMTNYLIMSIQECGGVWSDKLTSAGDPKLAVYHEPEILKFKLNDQISSMISDAQKNFFMICNNIDTFHKTFNHTGKRLLKAHRIHPEAFVQCAIHTAYFRLHKKLAPAYVTASTRRFYRGRTETCRSAYPEMRDFVVFMNDDGAQRDPKRCYELLKKSVEKFQKVMGEASNGLGCDRHLLGLYLTAILDGHEVPELFEDELVQRNNNYILSTSCSGYWNICGGVVPLVDDGYGCFYGIEDDAITFCCTAYKSSQETDLAKFISYWEETLLQLQKVLMNNPKL